jgi:hypothetical protein
MDLSLTKTIQAPKRYTRNPHSNQYICCCVEIGIVLTEKYPSQSEERACSYVSVKNASVGFNVA